MKLHNESAVLESSGLTEQKSFAVNTHSAKLFDILQNSMYTDKVLAPVREYLCNALDAHTQISNTAPFDVYLPNANVPEWVVRDYGPGLSHHDVMHLFTTYLQSTKDDSNNLIGGFGLGSKSAFAYTDQFVVVSYFNGTVTRYVCFIDDERMPAVSVVDKQETAEPNGLMIRVPVRHDQFSDFYTRTKIILSFFPEGSYNTIGLRVEPYKPDSIKPGLWLKHDVTKYNGEGYAYVLMGHVLYAIPPKFAGENTFLKAVTAKRTETILLANIGDCSLNPSRETLSLDKKTVQWLNDTCENHYTALTAEATATLSTAKNIFEYGRMALHLQYTNSSAFIPNYRASPFIFAGGSYEIAMGDFNVYLVQGAKGGPPRLFKDAPRVMSSNTPICFAPKTGTINAALLKATPDLQRFYYSKKGSRRFRGGGPLAVVLTREDAAKLNITPDFDLEDYATAKVKGPKAEPVRWARRVGDNAKVDISAITGQFAYFEQGGGDVNTYNSLSALRSMRTYTDKYSNFDMYAVPPGNVKHIKAQGAMDLDALINLRISEIIAQKEAIETRWFFEQMNRRNVTPWLVRNGLNLFISDEQVKMYNIKSASYFRSPQVSDCSCTTARVKIEAVFETMYLEFAAKHAVFFANIDAKISKNPLLFRAICHADNDTEVVEYLKSLME